MKNVFRYFLAFVCSLSLTAQVPKKIVVEHFTNTRCSICAGKNPGFYTNLSSHPEVLHLAIHPSAPYPACVLNQHNVQENDSRTNYYGIYGGTPNLIINGELIPTSVNFSSDALFAPYENLLSPLSIRIEQVKYANDSLRAKLIIKTVASHTLTNLILFVALAEDTVFYNAPNGENVHHDVFRKSLTGAVGISFSVASAVGDSVTYSKSSAANSAWNFSRINTLAILQDATTKSLVQSEYTSQRGFIITGIQNYQMLGASVKVFVSDAEGKKITVKNESVKMNAEFVLSDIMGRVVLTTGVPAGSGIIRASNLTKGIYLYVVKSQEQILKTGKLLIE
ncbi:hypothetical protein CNR22_01330 [Sphingobacteriaceae bacterium]|nr:hypothetical protein CNR22_01330 [Sphingobacteriaceae bacterium]